MRPIRATSRGVSALSRVVPLVLLLFTACKRHHVSVADVPELPYPGCSVLPDGGALSGHLRAGPFSIEPGLVERFDILPTTCGQTYRGRQEWRLQATDVEVVYDERGLPVRAWKRATLPGTMRSDGFADIRRYEMRTPEVTIKHLSADGTMSYEQLLPGGRLPFREGAKPTVVLAPGRGIVSMWIRRAHLAVGQESRELVLDIRAPLEVLEVGVLRRDVDRQEPSLNRTVRVYTFFGQETVFADEHDVVLGDLAGLRPSDSLTTPEPPSIPMYGEPDPVHTP